MAPKPSEEEELAPDAHGLYDATWQDAEWMAMVERLVADGFVTWKEAAATLLGELNPPQVGTQDRLIRRRHLRVQSESPLGLP